MTDKIVSVKVGTNLHEAHQMMKSKRIRHLPVVENDGAVIGILSQRDINYVVDSKNLTVELMMSAPVQYVDNNTPLRNAILLMLEKKISSVLITDSTDEIVGIVTTDDILWHLAHLLTFESNESSWKSSATDLQTIGAVANTLSAAGI